MMHNGFTLLLWIDRAIVSFFVVGKGDLCWNKVLYATTKTTHKNTLFTALISSNMFPPSRFNFSSYPLHPSLHIQVPTHQNV